jgi:hypothetical protein
VHDLRRQHGLFYDPVRPPDDLGGQHRADADLLAETDQQCGDPGRVGLRQLGQIPDPHQHLGVGTTAADVNKRVDAERQAALAQR